jgi:DNA repair photolyase
MEKTSHFTCDDSKTGIADSSEFEKKGLAEKVVNIGHLCRHSCSYCYADPQVWKFPQVQEIAKTKHLESREFSLYRTKKNVLDCIWKDLIKISRGDESVVFFAQLVILVQTKNVQKQPLQQ